MPRRRCPRPVPGASWRWPGSFQPGEGLDRLRLETSTWRHPRPRPMFELRWTDQSTALSAPRQPTPPGPGRGITPIGLEIPGQPRHRRGIGPARGGFRLRLDPRRRSFSKTCKSSCQMGLSASSSFSRRKARIGRAACRCRARILCSCSVAASGSSRAYASFKPAACPAIEGEGGARPQLLAASAISARSGKSSSAGVQQVRLDVGDLDGSAAQAAAEEFAALVQPFVDFIARHGVVGGRRPQEIVPLPHSSSSAKPKVIDNAL